MGLARLWRGFETTSMNYGKKEVLCQATRNAFPFYDTAEKLKKAKNKRKLEKNHENQSFNILFQNYNELSLPMIVFLRCLTL